MTQVATSPSTFQLQHDLNIKLQQLQWQHGEGFISKTIRQVYASLKPSRLTAQTEARAGGRLARLF